MKQHEIMQKNIGFCYALRYGWSLYRRNILFICISCILILLANTLRQYLLDLIEVALGGGYGDFSLDNLSNVMVMMSSGTQRIPLGFPQNVVLVAFEMLTQILAGFLSFCATLFLTAKSLLLIQNKEASLSSVREWVPFLNLVE